MGVGLELVPDEGLLLSGLQGSEDLMELIGDLVMVLGLLIRQVVLFFHRVTLGCTLDVHLAPSLQLLLLLDVLLLLEVVHLLRS